MPRPITDSVVTEQAASLNAGGWAFTPRQLYYAVCGAVETAPTSATRGELGCGLLLLLLTIISLGGPKALTLALALLTVAALLSALRSRQRDRVRALLASGRSFPLSVQEFEDGWVRPRRLHGAERLEGMLLDPENTAPVVIPDAELAGDVIVCDRRETAALLQANAERAGITVPIIDEQVLGTDARPARVFAVHDADPPGCGLPVRLAAVCDVVVDVGLRPEHVNSPDAQVIEGAPAILSSDLAMVLDPDDRRWLISGRRGEAAMLPPITLLSAIAAAVNGDPVPYLVSSTGLDSVRPAFSAPASKVPAVPRHYRVPIVVRLPSTVPTLRAGRSSAERPPSG